VVRSHPSLGKTAACGFALLGALLTSGCSSSTTARTTVDSDVSLASSKGGAQLWTENCARCHNTRSPDYYSPGQWAIVGEHMRVRGYLTGEEAREVTAFLQSQ